MFKTKSILTAILLSSFIYFEYFNYSYKIVTTIFALYAVYLLFTLNSKQLFGTGFMIGIFWFWWLSYSFIYYELSYLIPIVLIGIGLLYGILFYFINLLNNIFYKIGYIFLLSFIEPFGFNWFKIELPFINTLIGTSKIEFLIVLIATSILIKYLNLYYKRSIVSYTFIIILLSFYNFYNTNTINEPNLKIYKYQTNISQNEKWKLINKEKIIFDNFKTIQNAIDNKYQLIIFPETAFPLVLNYQNELYSKLLEKSKYISIVVGSLYAKDGLYYNSTYLFQNSGVEVAHKVVLVPFGEAVPLPQKITNWINDTFYNGAKDYETAKEPTTFDIKGTKFRNAICYEATTDEIYKKLDTPYVIATSNNAWFTPSHQPTLQKLLFKYYAKKYNLYILNVSNE
ncbi:MAG: apolipoprotein N-acyltransferase [Campylobacterota bacterium]|nr:apolipoprotein N-acyltransferase [Campylobacterota bacterium]